MQLGMMQLWYVMVQLHFKSQKLH